MHNRFSLPVFLTAFLVCGAALWDFVPHAHACSPAIVTMGLDVGDDIKEYLDPMPLDGSWAFPATRVDVAQKENQSEIVVTIAVQNDRDGDVNGRVTFVPMSQKFVDADYETQELLVVWTPDQPLTANTTFHVTVHYERRRGDDVVDEWEKESSFFTQDAATTDEAAAWVDGEPKASYTETPAYDMQCEEKEPCTSCGCGTLFWSTRYAYRPTLDMTLSFPLVPNPRQQYVVVEDDAGTIYDVHWTYQETADLHYTFDEDTALPVCLNVKTYTLSSDSPFASSRICANDEDFPTLERRDFSPEERPSACGSSDTTGEDGHNGDDQKGDEPPEEDDVVATSDGCGACDATGNVQTSFLGLLLIAVLWMIRPKRRNEMRAS